jgi:hypothetical protein
MRKKFFETVTKISKAGTLVTTLPWPPQLRNQHGTVPEKQFEKGIVPTRNVRPHETALLSRCQ